MDEEKGSLKPVQETKILKKFNFSASLEEEDEKVDLKDIIQQLAEIEKILSE